MPALQKFCNLLPDHISYAILNSNLKIVDIQFVTLYLMIIVTASLLLLLIYYELSTSAHNIFQERTCFTFQTVYPNMQVIDGAQMTHVDITYYPLPSN
jgi:hypothetical protein